MNKKGKDNTNEKDPLKEEIDSLKKEIDQLKNGKPTIVICKECGAENSSSSKFCTSCGSVLNNQPNENTENKNTFANKDRLAKKSLKKEINFDNQVVNEFKYIDAGLIILLTVLTCGLYGYYLVYKWVEVINSIEEEDSGLTTPIGALLLSLFTCGIGFIYFMYKIPERAAYLARKTEGNTNKKRAHLKPPVKDLHTISLLLLIGLTAASWFGVFFTAYILNIFLFPLAVAAYAWMYLSIQRSVEYLACIPKID